MTTIRGDLATHPTGPARPGRWTRLGRGARNAVAAVLLAALGVALLGFLLVVEGATIFSLAGGTGGAGDWAHVLLYSVTVVALPVALLWAVQGLAELHRARLRETRKIDITRPATDNSWWPIGPWRSGTTWRAFGYHAVALAVGPVGRWDVRTARLLLGPGRREQLARQVEALTRSRAETVAAADAERRRIERDLHDGAQQRLVSLAVNLGIARATLTGLPEPAARAIADAHDEAVLALEEMRAFIRGLHPAVLNDRGLDAALSGLVARSPVPVRLVVDVAGRTSASVEAVAYFIVSEALTNVAKYAQATRAEVSVVRHGDRLRIRVVDDGRGGAASTGEGTGLRGLAQRAASVDGTLKVDSPTGGPTTITAELPCES